MNCDTWPCWFDLAIVVGALVAIGVAVGLELTRPKGDG